MKHAAAPLPLLPRVQAYYLTGETLTAHTLVMLADPAAYGDAVASDGSLPLAVGVTLYTGAAVCDTCGTVQGVFLLEDMDGPVCGVCLLADMGMTPAGHETTLAILPVSLVEGVPTE
jgi:hypothetical protein